MRIHYANQTLYADTHKITVGLVGCGGTGSLVLTLLGRMNEALIGLGRPGIHVTVYDGDIVTETNVGRQMFSPTDIGMNKAVVAVSRVNRFFGTDWIAIGQHYEANLKKSEINTKHNIIISCVDSVKARKRIKSLFTKTTNGIEPYHHMLYWMDFGNSHQTGQVILGTINEAKQPSSKHETIPVLPDFLKHFPSISKQKELDEGPSCSIAQALNKQDLYINSSLANLGIVLLWKLMTEYKIYYRGLYLNLSNMTTNPIKV